MRFKKVLRIFQDGNVCVCGLRGRGKDLLMANVIARRKLPYVSNVDYGGLYNEFDMNKIDCGKNTFKDFINGTLKYYKYPYADKTDIYISDCGVYFPSQFCSELNRYYQHMSVFQALSRHVGKCNFHVNAQALNRIWDKIREQSDTYILCRKCRYLWGLVIQQITIYDRYESALQKMKPLNLRTGALANKEMRLHARMMKEQFTAQYGEITTGILFYRNKSNYDTRRFKKLLEEGTTE